MKKQRTWPIVIIIIIAVIGAFAIYKYQKDWNSILLNKNQSQFTHYEIDNNNILLYYTLSLENRSGTRRNFMIEAYSERDYKSGLLADGYLIAMQSEQEAAWFTFENHEPKLTIEVCLVGALSENIINTNPLDIAPSGLLPSEITIIDMNTGSGFTY